MIRFANLYKQLDATTKTNQKVAALVDYFSSVDAADAAWATYFLAGNRLSRLIPSKYLRQCAADAAGIPDWLFEECYHSVGDLAETISLVVPPSQSLSDRSLTDWIDTELSPLGQLSPQDQQQRILEIWSKTNTESRFVVMKLMTGGFRVGVSKGLLIRALAKQSGVSPDVIAHRMMGQWKPSRESFEALINPDETGWKASRPYPFCLANPIPAEKNISHLGDSNRYLAEWKWDGIRCQIIRRESQVFLWSRGDMLMENTWPEIESAAQEIPNGTVLDGEILATNSAGSVLPFDQLQRRIGRKRVGKKLLHEVPVVFHAFDLLEFNGEDIRQLPFHSRRERLEVLFERLNHTNLKTTEVVHANQWQELAEKRSRSRENLAEGLMLKEIDSPYSVGRPQGHWWKWKVDAETIDAVLIYAQKGHGQRANLFSDYTFAVWDGDALVPFAKAYSGLNRQEIQQVDRFVRQNTNDTFGPVRSVTPQLVMEIAFEGIRKSKRHKCGVATRFPRISRWRHDKQPTDANTLSDLHRLIETYREPPSDQ